MAVVAPPRAGWDGREAPPPPPAGSLHKEQGGGVGRLYKEQVPPTPAVTSPQGRKVLNSAF